MSGVLRDLHPMEINSQESYDKESRILTVIIMEVIRKRKEVWIESYEELVKRRISYKKILSPVLIVFNMLVSTVESKDNTATINLLLDLLLTRRKELKHICFIATANMDFDASLDSLEDRKDMIGSGRYVLEADVIKYMYNIRNTLERMTA